MLRNLHIIEEAIATQFAAVPLILTSLSLMPHAANCTTTWEYQVILSGFVTWHAFGFYHIGTLTSH